jgi:hypothetical protein
MSGFLTGLVRRSAGLPSLVKLSPSTESWRRGNLAAPPVGEPITGERADDRQTTHAIAPQDDRHVQVLPRMLSSEPVVSPSPSERARGGLAAGEIAVSNQPIAPSLWRGGVVEGTQRLTAEGRKRSPDVAAPQNVKTGIVVVQEAAVDKVSSSREDGSLERNLSPSPPLPSSPLLPPQPSAPPSTRLNKLPETGGSSRTSRRSQGSESNGYQRPAESHNIQVKIGRVEIRSIQPQATPRLPAAKKTGGFDDLKLSRTYFDRGLR